MIWKQLKIKYPLIGLFLGLQSLGLLFFSATFAFLASSEINKLVLQEKKSFLSTQALFIQNQVNNYLDHLNTEISEFVEGLPPDSLLSLEPLPPIKGYYNTAFSLVKKEDIPFSQVPYFDPAQKKIIFPYPLKKNTPQFDFILFSVPVNQKWLDRLIHFHSDEFWISFDNQNSNLSYANYSQVIQTNVSGLHLSIHSKDTLFSQLHRGLTTQMSLLLLLLFFVFFIYSYLFGRRLFVLPIQELKRKTKLLSAGFEIENPSRLEIVSEWAELSTQFDEMIVKIKEREEDLKLNRRELQETLRKVQDQQLQIIHSEKLSSIGTLAAGIAHEINNPITYVQNNLYSLKEYYGELQQLAEVAIKIPLVQSKVDHEEIQFILQELPDIFADTSEGLRKITKIVKSLKSFSRESSEIPEKINLVEVVENALNMTWNELKYKAELHKSYHEPVYINGFRDQLGQIIINLIINAIHAIKTYGQIEISINSLNNQAILFVKDDGVGMDEQTLQKIFDPFFTTKSVEIGTGLGLSISLDIAKKHGGSLKVESNKGKGTTVYLILPLANE